MTGPLPPNRFRARCRQTREVFGNAALNAAVVSEQELEGEAEREAGARKVYFASAAPPVCCPNVYGIDMPAANELIANGRSIEEVQELIGADRLIYQDLHGLIRSVRHDNSDIREFDTSCFSGAYVTGDVTDEYLHEIEQRRNDAAKQRRDAEHRGISLADGVSKPTGQAVGL